MDREKFFLGKKEVFSVYLDFIWGKSRIKKKEERKRGRWKQLKKEESGERDEGKKRKREKSGGGGEDDREGRKRKCKGKEK